MTFKHLRLSGWRQFKSVEIDFHPNLTIVTGSNGAGKTTILNVLNAHYGWQGQLVSTPMSAGAIGGGYTYLSDLWDVDLIPLTSLFLEHEATKRAALDSAKGGMTAEYLEQLESQLGQVLSQISPKKRGSLATAFVRWVDSGRFDPIDMTAAEQKDNRPIGQVGFIDGTISQILVPTKVTTSYQVQFSPRQQVKGLHIPSHRPIYAYQPVQSIATAPKGREQMIAQYTEIIRNRYMGHHHERTPNYYIKETLITLATFGYGNQVVDAVPEYLSLFEDFQKVLSLVLPPTLGFQRLSIRIPEVVLVTKTGDFSLDAVSGGLASIIDIAWQLFMYSPKGESFVATYDEPENHLHPELQRSFLPNLLKAFPAVQFIVASHNPFMVSSVPGSNVYVLRYDETNKVVSKLLDTVNRAGTANEILRDVLGLEYTLPLWVEGELDKIVAEFEKEPITPEGLDRLRAKMKALRLDQYVPETIAKLVDAKGDE